MSDTLPHPLPLGPSSETCCAPATEPDPALDVDRIAAVAKALAEPIRIQILDVVRRHGEPLCQCELLPLFEIPQSTLSHHIKKLTDAGLITVERRHKWAYYSPAPDGPKELTTWLT